MSLVREPGSEVIAQFTLPKRGTWRNTAINEVPLDAVYDSHNIFIREGKLRSRPGLETLPAVFPYDATWSKTILGGAMAVVTQPIYDNVVVAPSRNRLYLYSDSTNLWTSIPTPASPAMGPTDTDPVDIAFLETSGAHYSFFANRSRPILQWRGTDTSVTLVAASGIPSAKSICIAASRLIGLVYPHTVVWSRVLDPTIFDPLAVVRRAQTSDVGICVRALSALSFVLYKEYSIHTARAQAGIDESTAFSFAEPVIAEGPAGIYAVVDVNGAHIYMTKSGRIALFDGTSYPRWIADGIWFYLQNDIHKPAAYGIRGVYDYRLNCVIFFYPRGTEVGDMTGMVIVNLPFPGFEQQEGLRPYCFLGVCGTPVVHACTYRFDLDLNRAIVFNRSSNPGEAPGIPHSHNISENVTGDRGVPFTSYFQTGLQALPDARHMQITTEVFAERGAGLGTVGVQPVYSHLLEEQAGTMDSGDIHLIDLTGNQTNEYIGFYKKARFFGLRFEWQSTALFKYSGAVVYSSQNRTQR